MFFLNFLLYRSWHGKNPATIDMEKKQARGAERTTLKLVSGWHGVRTSCTRRVLPTITGEKHSLSALVQRTRSGSRNIYNWDRFTRAKIAQEIRYCCGGGDPYIFWNWPRGSRDKTAQLILVRSYSEPRDEVATARRRTNMLNINKVVSSG